MCGGKLVGMWGDGWPTLTFNVEMLVGEVSVGVTGASLWGLIFCVV